MINVLNKKTSGIISALVFLVLCVSNLTFAASGPSFCEKVFVEQAIIPLKLKTDYLESFKATMSAREFSSQFKLTTETIELLKIADGINKSDSGSFINAYYNELNGTWIFGLGLFLKYSKSIDPYIYVKDYQKFILTRGKDSKVYDRMGSLRDPESNWYYIPALGGSALILFGGEAGQLVGSTILAPIAAFIGYKVVTSVGVLLNYSRTGEVPHDSSYSKYLLKILPSSEKSLTQNYKDLGRESLDSIRENSISPESAELKLEDLGYKLVEPSLYSTAYDL